ncbi:MAG: molybdate ABC transporter substrate-binding protein [Methanomicrobiales archaeon HGW-Methanomicrobiales-1]|jgi:molybdate transport system substrate-binding protein|nr:MAG: molybdate ABC transporter substrate-binding protein [Methanomicrobiales archaeon HGW-Methanomicrobiales-1]
MTRRISLISLAAGITILALLLAAGCTSSGTAPAVEKKELTVFTAASLTGAMTDIATAYEALHPDTKIVLNFDGSQALRTQIEQGAPADLFLSANTKHMSALQGEGLMVNESVAIFAKNKLALIVPKENRANITGLPDLAQPGIRLVMGTKEVPFGDYTRQALGKMANDSAYGPAYRDAVMNNVVSEDPAVTALVAHIRLGEADAGIAYASDVSEGDRLLITTIPIPDQYNVIASYPLGIVQDSPVQDRAAAFVEFIESPEGSAILTRYGFTPVSH